jgi:exodeoxyribonuclease VII large subunit
MVQTVTLYQLTEFVKRVIALNFQDLVWVTAEIAQMGTTRGHRYLDLVEHGEEGVIAQLSAVLWQGDYRKLKIQHGVALDQLLTAGTQVKLGIFISFHERYGLKAQIQEIDLEWTFGNLELQKRKTLELLKTQGLLEANKRHPLPSVLQNIAVISSEKAAGLQDFVQQLRGNQYGYAFRISLFDTLVQGPQAEAEIIKVLHEINSESTLYDCVVLIRGGGARLDLAVFDQLELNKMVAKMPIPVLVGIGHDTDQTVLDLVAHTALKTPTAVAEFVVQHNVQFEVRLRQISHSVIQLSQSLCSRASFALENAQQQLRYRMAAKLQSTAWQLDVLEKNLPKAAKNALKTQEAHLNLLETRLVGLDPRATLLRGFSITRYAGKAITSTEPVPVGAEIETETADGRLVSMVKTKTKNSNGKT